MCAHHQSSPRSMFTKGRFCTIATADIWAAVMQCGQHLSGEDERLVEHARLQMGDGPVEGRLTLSGRVDANRHHNRLSLVRCRRSVCQLGCVNTNAVANNGVEKRGWNGCVKRLLVVGAGVAERAAAARLHAAERGRGRLRHVTFLRRAQPRRLRTAAGSRSRMIILEQKRQADNRI